MGAKGTFRQILEEKIAAQSIRYETHSEGFDPTLFESFAPKTETFTWQTQRAQQAYPRPVRQRPSRKAFKAPYRPDPYIHRGGLDETSLQALNLLGLQSGVSLGELIYLSELKRAFRLSALRNHPDTGGAAATFMAVKQAYDHWIDLFKEKGSLPA